MRMGIKALAAAALLALAACGDREGSVGEFSNDLLGNEIMVEALRDPAIPGVVCHFSYFARSVLDRLRQGNWFENPSNWPFLRAWGRIDLAWRCAARAKRFSPSARAFLFKNVALRRIVDPDNATLIYFALARNR